MPAAADDRPTDALRVLVASHSHPRVQNGGSEVASHALFDRLRERPGIQAWYCGCARSTAFARAGQSITQPFGPDEFMYSVGEFEGFKFANRDMAFARDFRRLLADLRPDIVHFHHYVNFGMEAFAHVREVLPEARIVLTLHEFLAICHQQGQMVTRPQERLCSRSGHVECSRCFPEIQPADFFIREIYIRHFLKHVHQFIAPSRFLAQRYVDWGIPAGRMSVIENVAAETAPACRTALNRDPAVLRVGFFGQISVLKGILVLIEAAAILADEERSDIVLSIHGDDAGQPESFRKTFVSLAGKFGRNITFEGAYANPDVDALMQNTDIVVVPSIWWENSPVVIQEAFRNGCPVICSDIGGMAEKVSSGETGLHFRNNSARSLANALKALVADPGRLAQLRDGVARQIRNDTLPDHLKLYRDLHTRL